MAYLGRPGATAPLTSADIPDNSITAAKIVDATIVAADLAPNSVDSSELVDGSVDNSHLADDAVGTDELANDVVINTSGAITTTGGMTVDGATVFNETGANVDFRIETDGNANMFCVNGGTNRVGIGTDSPLDGLHISGQNLAISEGEEIKWVDGSGNKSGRIYTGSDDVMHFCNTSSDTERFTINANGQAKFTTNASGNPFWIQNNASSGCVEGIYYKTTQSLSGCENGWAILYQDSAGTKFIVYNDGDIQGKSYNNLSDERQKEDIVDAGDVLDKLNLLKVRNFKWKERGIGDEVLQIGLVAQEVNLLDSSLVHQGTIVGDDDPDMEGGPLKSINQTRLTYKLLKGIQELSAKNDALEAENTALKTRMDALEARVTVLEG